MNTAFTIDRVACILEILFEPVPEYHSHRRAENNGMEAKCIYEEYGERYANARCARRRGPAKLEAFETVVSKSAKYVGNIGSIGSETPNWDKSGSKPSNGD